MSDSKKSIAIMQPTFFPWIGYFSMLDKVETFVFLDSVQFAKRSWQQRNQIKTATGAQWITLPVSSSGRRDQLIREAQISREGAPELKIINGLKTSYSKAPFFSLYSDLIFTELLREKEKLCDLNINLILLFQRLLGIENKKILRSSEMTLEGSKADLLVLICQQLGYQNYLSAPASRDYIEESGAFQQADIEVRYHDYKHPVYRQLFGEFVPYMCIVDLLFNEGPASLSILRGEQKGLEI